MHIQEGTILTQELGANDLGTFAYVSRVYNENIQLPEYKLPTSTADGTQTFFDTDEINLKMEIDHQRVQKITIVTPKPHSLAYMRCLKALSSGWKPWALGSTRTTAQFPVTARHLMW